MVGWLGANSGGKTHPVGELKPNAFGLYDMHGNVWEWCSDWHADDYYAISPMDDPIGPTGGSKLVTRGGGWDLGAGYSRSSSRSSWRPTKTGSAYALGFRVAAVPSNSASTPTADGQDAHGQLDATPPAQTREAPPLAKAPFDAELAKAHQEAWAKHLSIEVETTNSIGMKMRLIPPGEFLMGSTDQEIQRQVANTEIEWMRKYIPSEGPQHRVTITQPEGVGLFKVSKW